MLTYVKAMAARRFRMTRLLRSVLQPAARDHPCKTMRIAMT
jgi:hypothetical protein